MTPSKVLGARALVVVPGQLIVVELHLGAAADAQLELATAEPGGALLRFGDVGPHALDRAGQQALQADGGGGDKG